MGELCVVEITHELGGELCNEELDNEPPYLQGDGLGVVSLLLLSLPPSRHCCWEFDAEDLLRVGVGHSNEVLAADMVFSAFSESPL